MTIYNLHMPHPTKQQALSIPLYLRTGKQVTQVLAVNKETRHVICAIEGSDSEHTYDMSDLVHHYGQRGIRHYLEASG